MSKTAKRLYSEFQPKHYQLHIHPDRDSMTFTGTVVISGQKVYRPNQRLTFHQKDLKITKASIIRHDKKGDQSIEVARINHHAKYYEVRLHTDQILYPGQYTVQMEFEGKITPQMTGIYPCLFDHDGQKKSLIATQFESHHAREAFPCIDEPEAKAIFDLSLTAPKGEVVLGNTPVASEKTDGDLTVTTFEPTPRMSTYLLAFVIGEMHSVERATKDGIVVRSWSTVAQPKSHLNFSVDEAVAILEFFTDYFGVPYPLAKCDQVALPDFDSGAMENWGLITYREVALLADDQNRSVSNEQYVSMVVAHELSHQWFGNLVTMKWWDDLWLNESFASLMEHLALDAIHPEWKQWEAYASYDILSTSSRDVFSDIQPVQVEVTDPDLLHTLFDPGIVYAKGGRLLKMLREHIGDDKFAQALKAYFTDHAYGNATRDDLWAAMSKASGQDIAKLMNPWLTQSGMPVVHVTQKGQQIQVAQERFLLDGPSDEQIWPVPLLADKALSPNIFEDQSAEVTAPNDDFVIINQSGSGHYFTHYTETEHLSHVTQALTSGKLPAEARINTLNDLYMLSRHGDAPLVDGLDLVISASQEPRDNVWSPMLRIVGAAAQLTEGDKTAEDRLKQLRFELAKYWHDQLGWEDAETDDFNTKQLRHTMASLMIGGENKGAIETALQKYKAAKDLQSIHAELRNTILTAAVRFGDQTKVIDKLLADYPAAPPDVQSDITSALANNRDPKLAQMIIDKGLGEGGFVRPQDIMRWIASFMRNPYVRSEMWDFVTSNWQRIEEILGASKSYDFLPVYCAGVISTEEWAAKYHDFFEPLKENKSLRRNILVGTADIKARIAWRQRDEAKIAAWLQERYS